MILVKTLKDLKINIAKKKNIALVPTMGSLHEGHVELVKLAKRHSDFIIVSIFVNPLQFSPGEDFQKYPRNLSSDFEILNSLECVDILFAPNQSELNIDNDSFKLFPPFNMIRDLEGKFRDNFLPGVCTIILKLLICISPSFIVLGKKDYQQMIVIERMCKNLLIPITVLRCDTLREHDGLAKSSRNIYLSYKERKEAYNLYKCLLSIKDNILNGIQIDLAEYLGIRMLTSRGWVVDYISVRYSKDLSIPISNNLKKEDSDLVILVAAKLNSIRLIDNIEF